MEDYFVKLISAGKSYGDEAALNDISIGLHRGRIAGVLGVKGSGKSTLCRLLCGIEKPDSGKILIDGKKITKNTKKRIMYLLGENDIMKFKKPSELMDFYENFYPGFSREKAIRLMRLLRLDTEKKITNDKGINQLIALSCLGAGEADLYILDEPLNYFDRAEREYYLKEVLRTLDNSPLAVISTEILRGTETLFDDVVLMYKGRVKLCKSAAEIRVKTGKTVEDFYKEVYGFC